MFLKFAARYIQHFLTAHTRHGTHSPFVYALASNVVYKHNQPHLPQVEALRRALKADDRILQVQDLGAGSHMHKNTQKKVSTIARGALKSPKLAKLLYRIADYYQVQNVIELGTCLGITTAYLASVPGVQSVTTIEGCPHTSAIAQENMHKLGLQNVQVLTGNFNTVLPPLLAQQPLYHFVYIDGNHRYSATLKYFNDFLPHVSESSIMVFDDIYWSDGMLQAWEEIKQHPAVTLTVDFFWIGLVFFKTGQAKQHFKLRI